MHGEISDLTKGIRSVVDAKGNFVTSRAVEAEEEEPIHLLTIDEVEPNFVESDVLFETGNDPDSEDEDDADECEMDVDDLLEYFAETN